MREPSVATALRGQLRIAVISGTDTRDVRLAKQCHELQRLGHEVVLLVIDGRTGEHDRLEGFGALPSEVFGMTLPPEGDGPSEDASRRSPSMVARVRSRVSTRLAGWKQRFRMRRGLRRVVRRVVDMNADLVKIHRAGLAVEILKRHTFACPVIVDFHELPKSLHGRRFPPAPGTDDDDARRRSAEIVDALRGAALVTAEELIAVHLRDEFGLATIPVPNTVASSMRAEQRPDPSSAVGVGPSLRMRLGLTDEQQLIVFLGFYLPNRGVERLIEAMALLPDDHHLALVVGWTGRPLRAHVRSAAAAARIHLVDLVAPDELVAFLRGADLGVYLPDDPSKPHAFLCTPTKLFEFHMAGVPMLVADDPGLLEFVDRYGGAAVLERPFRAEDIAAAISEVLEGRRPCTPRSDIPDMAVVMRQVLNAVGWQDER